MWTTPRGGLCRWGALWLVLLAGCAGERPAPGPDRTPAPSAIPAADPLAIPPGSSAVRLRGSPETGGRVTFENTADRGSGSVVAALPDGRDTSVSCLERWLLEPFLPGPAGSDTLFVAVRRITSPEADDRGTDAAFMLVWRRRVILREDPRPRWTPGTGFSPRRTIRTRRISSDPRAILFLRTDTAGIPGSERYRAFGFGPSGTLLEFTGPVEHFRDADLPASLAPGQVVYARVCVAWYSVPLPLTFEPRRFRFVPEVGDDAMFSATGKAVFRGHPDGSSLIRLYSSTAPGASSVSLPIPPRTEAEARKAYLPHLLPGAPRDAAAGTGMVYVTIGSLEGWLPDSLVGRFSP